MKIEDLKIDDNIIVCGTLETKVKRIEENKIYFDNNINGIEEFETIDAIELNNKIEIQEKIELKHFVIDCAVYPFDLFCFFGEIDDMLESLQNYINTETITDKEYNHISKFDFGDGCFIMSPDNFCVLYIKSLPTDAESIGIIVHEIFHATSEILRKCGIEKTVDNEEVFAYFIQYLTTQIFLKLSE